MKWAFSAADDDLNLDFQSDLLVSGFLEFEDRDCSDPSVGKLVSIRDASPPQRFLQPAIRPRAMMIAHPCHGVPVGDGAPDAVNAIIEISALSR
jgi:hypothetical protein